MDGMYVRGDDLPDPARDVEDALRIQGEMFVVHDLSCLKVANFSVCADKMRFPASVQAGQRGKAGSAGEMRAGCHYCC